MFQSNPGFGKGNQVGGERGGSKGEIGFFNFFKVVFF